MAKKPNDIVINSFDSLVYDPISGGLVISPQDKAAVHGGRSYELAHYFTVASGATYRFLLIVGENDLHVPSRLLTTTGAPIKIKTFEDCLYTVKGSAIESPPKNVNRNYDDTPSFEIYHTPTATNGSQYGITSRVLGAALNPAQTAGGSSTSAKHHVLPQGNYILEITNENGSDIDVEIQWVFYEEKG